MSWHHGDWLSFAQAAVSAVAIVGAFGVVFIQHHLEGKRRRVAERSEARKVLRIAIAFTHRAWRAVMDIAEARSDPAQVEREADRKKRRSKLSQLMEVMNGLPIHLLPTPEAAEQLIRARSELAAAYFEASKHADFDLPGSPELGAAWHKWAARLADAVKKLREEEVEFS